MTGRDRVRAAYDELADDYAAASDGEGPDAALLADLGRRLGGDATVLDAGCGDGTRVTARLAAEHDAVGLDVSRAQLDRAARNLDAAPLVQGEMTALPFAADCFDAVTAYHSVIHVPRERHGEVFGEFARVLVPGGFVLLSTGKNGWEGATDDWLDSGVGMEWSFYGPERTTELLEAEGFAVVEEWTVDDSLGDEFVFLLAELR